MNGGKYPSSASIAKEQCIGKREVKKSFSGRAGRSHGICVGVVGVGVGVGICVGVGPSWKGKTSGGRRSPAEKFFETDLTTTMMMMKMKDGTHLKENNPSTFAASWHQLHEAIRLA